MTPETGPSRAEDGATTPEANPSRADLGLRSSTRDPEEMRAALERWLDAPGRRPGAHLQSVEVPERTGISSLTLLFEVSVPGGGPPERLVGRLAPDATAVPVFPSYDLEKQALLLAHLSQHSSVKVPRVHWYEGDTSALGVPFFVMDRVDGEIPPDVMPYPFGSWLSEADRADQRRLQESALEQLARVHEVRLPHELAARLQYDRAGSTALRRHVAEHRAYYEWAASDGVRSPLLEAGYEWLEDHWPADDAGGVGDVAGGGGDDAGGGTGGTGDGAGGSGGGAPGSSAEAGAGQAEDPHGLTLSWGDARIGNMIFDRFDAVALLDWEMTGIAPPGVDLGWMIYLHRWFDDIAETFGIAPMRHFMRVPEAVAAYERAGGAPISGDPEALRFYLFYAALRHGAIMFRVTRRQISFGEAVMPEDPDELVMHRATIAKMMSGEYWEGFEA
jgi:aminoglycoside phosphotransferase (APT) family kinase protein